MLGFEEYVKIFIGLLAILNPLGTIPIFISMTSGESTRQRRRTTNMVAFGVSIILLKFFGISIDSFRIGSGILLLLMAIDMLNAKTSPIRQTDAEATESIEKESVAIVPLAMPLLAGPGAISTVILAAHKAHGILHYLIIGLGILVLSLAIWGALRLAPLIEKRISATGINIFTRIMGLILAAIAVEFIANGLKGIFPGLG
jgi:multiple antibiotic resistance protein